MTRKVVSRKVVQIVDPLLFSNVHLSTKLTLQLYCKLICDSEKEQFTGRNWINKDPDILFHYPEWLKNVREGRKIFTCIHLGIFFVLTKNSWSSN